MAKQGKEISEDLWIYICSHFDNIARIHLTTPIVQAETLHRLFELAFCFKSIVLIVDASRYSLEGITHYAIAQSQEHDTPTDLNWVCHALNRLEPGWEIVSGILMSPPASNLSEGQIKEALEAGKNAYSVAVSTTFDEPAPNPVTKPMLGWRIAAVGLLCSAIGFLAGFSI